jgi:hypothetical protein
MKLLEKNPDNRYSSAADVKADLPPLPEELAAGSKVWTPSWYSSIKHNPAARNTIILCAIVLAVIIPLIPPFFLWQGPETDPGTPFEKLLWNVDIWLADRAKEIQKYEFAKARLDDAYSLAFQKLDLQKRLVTAGLQSMIGAAVASDPSGQWSGYTQRSIERVRETVRAIATKHYQNEKAFYENLGRNNTDAQERLAEIILSRAGQCELVARELQALRFYPEEEDLLTKALSVDEKILIPKDQTSKKKPDTALWRIADLKSQLAECYEHMHYIPPIRALLLEALRINENTQMRGPKSIDTLNAILQLGQFDLQQSDFKNAKLNLERAVKLAVNIEQEASEQAAKATEQAKRCAAASASNESYPKSQSTCDEEAAKAQQKAREAEALLIEANYSYADFLDQAGKRAESAPFLKSGDDCRTAELEALKTPSQKANQ